MGRQTSEWKVTLILRKLLFPNDPSLAAGRKDTQKKLDHSLPDDKKEAEERDGSPWTYEKKQDELTSIHNQRGQNLEKKLWAEEEINLCYGQFSRCRM